MKRLLTLSLFVLLALAVCSTFAAGTGKADPNKITGKMDIQFSSRTKLDDSGNPATGVKDVYTLDFQVTDTLRFQGTVEHLPTILGSVLGTEKQAGTLTYNVNLSVINPANASQSVNVGKLVGGVPINKSGVYDYDKGTLRIAVNATGAAQGFDSKFSGTAAGKPPKSTSVVARAKKQAITLTKKAQGKTVSLVVTDYDIMTFTGFTLAAGSVKSYPETKVSGEMLYDYERSAWYFRNMSMSYTGSDNKLVTDKISGNIKWVEDPQRKTNGQGEYQFDVRFNEPEQTSSEKDVFKPVEDESAFFAVDKTITSLTGTAKYKDQMRGETVASSAVTVDLTGNKLTKPQLVNAFKLIWLVSIVPMNAE
jgi:hypothetical protein